MAWSKPVSQWFQISPAPGIDQLDGDSLERNIYSGLLAIGVAVLVQRGRRVQTLVRINGPILVFLGYCALSTVWSDYPFVAFKRWTKLLGDVVMVMIVLTDPEQPFAIKRFLARGSFLMVPVSVLLIKYYPELGMKCWASTGKCQYNGFASDKNMLGAVCLVFGIGAVWRLLYAFKERQRTAVIAVGAILAMVLWLFWRAHSVTSIACFMIAITLLTLTAMPKLGRRLVLVNIVAFSLLAATASVLFLDVGSAVLEAVGKDPTLTDRTELWADLSSMVPNAAVGAGFESFWLGPRLLQLWSRWGFRPNEAHNGYLEVFLNLGGVGLVLLALVIATGYRKANGMLRRDREEGGLRLALIVIGMAYSFTEAGFRMQSPVWICFLLGAVVTQIRVPPLVDGGKRIPEESAVLEDRVLQT